MAELGNIDFTDVSRGTRPVDRRDEVRALRQALDVGKQVVEEGIKAKVTKDMNEAITDLPEPLAREEQDVTTSAITDPAQAKMASDLDRWKIQAAQGNSSQRTLAEVRIKEILNEAQANYPWMVEDLQARAGIVIAGSHELQELGLLDAANVSQAKAAQSQIDDIQKYAASSWEEGGLGISPSLEMGSPQWLAQYVELDKLRTQQQQNARAVGMTISNAEATATALEDAASLSLQGQFSTARAGRHSILSSNGFYAALAEVQKGDSGDLNVIRQFSTVGVPIIIDELEAQKLEVTQLYEVYFRGQLAGTAAGKRVKAMRDDYIVEQDSMINRFKSSVENMPSAMQQIDALNSIRGAEVMRGLTTPNQNFVAFTGGPGKNLIELSKLAKTAEGLVMTNQLGVQATGILQAQFPSFLGPAPTEPNRRVSAFMTSGQGTITPDLGAGDINARLDKIQRDSNSPWYVTTTTDKDELEAAFWSVDNHTALWNAALSVPDKYATPQAAAQYLTGVNNSLRAFNGIPEKPEDVSSVIRAGLADDRLLTAIDTVGDNVDVVAQRRAFGTSAKEWYVQTKPGQRQAQQAQAYNTASIHGVPLRDIAKVDMTAMTTDGTFNYSLDSKNFKVAVDKRFALLQSLPMTRGVARRDRTRAADDVRESVIKAMTPIVQEVNESITINRNLDHATAINADSRRRSNVKMQYFDELGWLDSFNYMTPE